MQQDSLATVTSTAEEDDEDEEKNNDNNKDKENRSRCGISRPRPLRLSRHSSYAGMERNPRLYRNSLSGNSSRLLGGGYSSPSRKEIIPLRRQTTQDTDRGSTGETSSIASCFKFNNNPPSPGMYDDRDNILPEVDTKAVFSESDSNSNLINFKDNRKNLNVGAKPCLSRSPRHQRHSISSLGSARKQALCQTWSIADKPRTDMWSRTFSTNVRDDDSPSSTQDKSSNNDEDDDNDEESDECVTTERRKSVMFSVGGSIVSGGQRGRNFVPKTQNRLHL